MMNTGCDLSNCFFYVAYMSRRVFCSKRTDTKLAMMVVPTLKQPADVVNECGVIRSAVNFDYVRLIVTFKVDESRRINNVAF